MKKRNIIVLSLIVLCIPLLALTCRSDDDEGCYYILADIYNNSSKTLVELRVYADYEQTVGIGLDTLYIATGSSIYNYKTDISSSASDATFIIKNVDGNTVKWEHVNFYNCPTFTITVTNSISTSILNVIGVNYQASYNDL